MCGIAEMSILATLASGVAQFQGIRAQGKAAQSEAEYKAAIAKNNQIRGEQLADDALARGEAQEQDARVRGRILLGLMRASLAGSGQVVDEGSAALLVEDQAMLNELNARRIRTNAEGEAEEFRFQAAQAGGEAALFQIAGETAKSESELSAFGTLLTTGQSVANKWFEFDQAGAF